jgi:hypothetical protein
MSSGPQPIRVDSKRPAPTLTIAQTGLTAESQRNRGTRRGASLSTRGEEILKKNRRRFFSGKHGGQLVFNKFDEDEFCEPPAPPGSDSVRSPADGVSTVCLPSTAALQPRPTDVQNRRVVRAEPPNPSREPSPFRLDPTRSDPIRPDPTRSDSIRPRRTPGRDAGGLPKPRKTAPNGAN